MTKEDILAYLKEQKKEFAKKYGVEKIALFGSYAREDSDIDIVIAMPPKYSYLFNLKEELEEALQKRVDVIRLRESMNHYLKRRIDKEAIYV